MRFLIFYLFFSSSLLMEITFEDLDFIRSISDKDSKSIISNGTSFCNDYFSKKTSSLKNNKDFKNIFLCKFSKQRNRFYIYMLSVQKTEPKSLKNFCSEFLNNWPNISDHMDPKFNYQNKEYLDGFYIENFYHDKVLSFSKDYQNNQRKIKNEIDNFIVKNRNNFTNNNQLNNEILKKEYIKINKIYKKITTKKISNLDTVISQQLKEIVRYKIFVNDLNNYQSYSCNWKPGKGKIPYVKIEKFSEFENI